MTHATGSAYSFPRACRLQGRQAFASVLAHKCSVAGEFVHVYAKPNGTAGSRLGITVNKKLVPQATARNYCKRLAREAFRGARAGLGGMDFVVRLRGPVLSAVSSQARVEVVNLLHRARGLCGERANAVRAR